jgi:hypothetical protein
MVVEAMDKTVVIIGAKNGDRTKGIAAIEHKALFSS